MRWLIVMKKSKLELHSYSSVSKITMYILHANKTAKKAFRSWEVSELILAMQHPLVCMQCETLIVLSSPFFYRAQC